MKKSATQLREEAKKLIDQAAEMEKGRALAIGKLVIKHEAAGFKAFDLTHFKAEIAKL